MDVPDEIFLSLKETPKSELREIIIGHSMNNRLLLVCFTEDSKVIRIISARMATKQERKAYEEHIIF